jgi:hypothetical protein
MKAGGTILTNMVLPTYHAGCFSKNEIPALQRIGGNAANRKPELRSYCAAIAADARAGLRSGQ